MSLRQCPRELLNGRARLCGASALKSECRNPKSETNSNAPNSNEPNSDRKNTLHHECRLRLGCFEHLDFEFWNLFRISNFIFVLSQNRAPSFSNHRHSRWYEEGPYEGANESLPCSYSGVSRYSYSYSVFDSISIDSVDRRSPPLRKRVRVPQC